MGDEVISWDSHWHHWWMTEKQNAGKNSGYAWLQQDDKDNCPGSGNVTVRRGGSDEVVDNASVIPSSQCKYFGKFFKKRQNVSHTFGG